MARRSFRFIRNGFIAEFFMAKTFVFACVLSGAASKDGITCKPQPSEQTSILRFFCLVARQKNAGGLGLSLPLGALGLQVADFAPALEGIVRNNGVAARERSKASRYSIFSRSESASRRFQ